jgi:hypothetical protein
VLQQLLYFCVLPAAESRAEIFQEFPPLKFRIRNWQESLEKNLRSSRHLAEHCMRRTCSPATSI